MSRLLRLSPRFHAAVRRLRIAPTTERGKRLGAALHALGSDDLLPGTQDAETMLPPTQSAFARRVPMENLWIWYVSTDAEVIAITVTDIPPTPID